MKKAILIILAVLILYAGLQFSSFGLFKTTGSLPEPAKAAETAEPPQEAVIEVAPESAADELAEMNAADDMDELAEMNAADDMNAAPEMNTAESEPATAPEAIPEQASNLAAQSRTDLPPLPEIDVSNWKFLLANSFNSIGMEYAPPYANIEGQGIDKRILDDATAFLYAAREACGNVWISTALRNSEFLNSWYLSYYNNVYNRDPIETANHFLAQGLDDHQTGLAIDFTDVMYRNALYEIFDDPEMLDTEIYRWAVEHCAEYGFILRYPEGKEAFYGVACRHPAHFRYVGEEAARYIMDNDLCLEEFLLLYEGNNVYVPKP